MLTRDCQTCNKTFAITKWQKTKKYCSFVCSKAATYVPTGNKPGRPKNKI